MLVIPVRNVNVAFRRGMSLLQRIGIPQPSRDGDVLTAPFPVVTQFERPMERVLFDEHRDANPFFHLFEAMWMLASSRDGKWLDRWVKDFSSRYGQPPGGYIHGAYGHRWRHHFDRIGDESGSSDGLDQISAAISLLSANSNTRQVVISMWDPTADLLAGPEIRDRPCNTTIFLRVRQRRMPAGAWADTVREKDGFRTDGEPDEILSEPFLDMTVSCRSNDIVWGAYGANAVHMSVLQELIATAIGVEVGRYWQISNDYHLYTGRCQHLLDKRHNWHDPQAQPDLYLSGVVSARPMFRREGIPSLQPDLLDWMEDPTSLPRMIHEANYELFSGLLCPMALAHAAYKSRDFEKSRSHLDNVRHSDWLIAATEWIERRRR